MSYDEAFWVPCVCLFHHTGKFGAGRGSRIPTPLKATVSKTVLSHQFHHSGILKVAHASCTCSQQPLPFSNERRSQFWTYGKANPFPHDLMLTYMEQATRLELAISSLEGKRLTLKLRLQIVGSNLQLPTRRTTYEKKQEYLWPAHVPPVILAFATAYFSIKLTGHNSKRRHNLLPKKEVSNLVVGQVVTMPQKRNKPKHFNVFDDRTGNTNWNCLVDPENYDISAVRLWGECSSSELQVHESGLRCFQSKI